MLAFVLFFALLLLSPTAYAQDVTTTPSPEPTITETPVPTQIPTPTIDPKVALVSQYKSDYLYQYDLYQKAYLIYTDKKQVHTKYGTLTTQKEKLDATKEVILARNRMLRAYLMVLRVNLDLYKDQNPTETGKLQIDLSKWEAWLDEQNLVANSFNNDEDVKKWASEFKTQFIPIQQTIYTSLVISESNHTNYSLNLVKDLASKIQQDPNISPVDQQYFSSLPVKTDLVTNALKSAIEETQKKQMSNKFSNFYPNSKANIVKANNYLLEMQSDLKAIATKLN